VSQKKIQLHDAVMKAKAGNHSTVKNNPEATPSNQKNLLQLLKKEIPSKAKDNS